MSKVKRTNAVLTPADITLKNLIKLREQEQTSLKSEELRKMLLPVQPFPESELTDESRQKRITRSKKDFWYFDKIYFPKELYDDYAPPNKFHCSIKDTCELQDMKAHFLIGPRFHAKTLTIKKYLYWAFLFGKRHFIGIGSETLNAPKKLMLDLMYTFSMNQRLAYDYKLDWMEESTESIYARSIHNPVGTALFTVSLEKSARGLTRDFKRPDFVWITDFENKTSSLTKEAIQNRYEVVNEIRGSLSPSGIVLLDLNNFDPETLTNQLVLEKEKGILSENVAIHFFQAWDEKKKEPLWPERFPAKTEAELKKLCKPLDEYDWAGNYQGKPRKKSGDIFPDTFYQTVKRSELPEDVMSVIYADPNTSLKGKGDTTGITNLGYSPTENKLFIIYARCKSYFRSNELLSDALEMLDKSNKCNQCISLNFDGSVTQESVWTNNILNFAQIKNVMYPNVKFKKYNIDALATNLEDKWKAGEVYFVEDFAPPDERDEYKKQYFGFRLKKANKADDAPDSAIGAYTSLVEEGIASVFSGTVGMMSVSNRKVKRI